MDKLTLKKHNIDILEYITNPNLEVILKYNPNVSNSIDEIAKKSPELINKAYLNTDLFNLTIKYHHHTKWSLEIAFNPNKVYSKVNEHKQVIDYLSNNQIFEVIDIIQTELYNKAINIELGKMYVKRYDFCIDVQTSDNPKAYNPIFRKIQPPPKYRQKTRPYDDTTYYTSKSSEVCIYNKSKQVLEKHNKEYLGIDDNTTRFEFRRLKAQRKNLETYNKPLEEVNIDIIRVKSYKRLLELFQLDILTNDIEEQIIKGLNDTSDTINKLITELQKQTFLIAIKDVLMKNEYDKLQELIYKDMTQSEKERISRLNREIKELAPLTPYLKYLYEEIRNKLTTKIDFYQNQTSEYKTYKDYQNGN